MCATPAVKNLNVCDKEREETIMSDVKEAQQFFEQVQRGATKYTSIPDAGLQQKIKKVSEGAGQVVEHIKERTNPQKG